MEESPRNVRFKDLCRVSEHFFGPPRLSGGSHRIYKTPWAKDPMINIQEGPNGTAKIYQIKQVLHAVRLLRTNHEPQE